VTSALPVGAAIPGDPAWFGPAMAAALAAINAQLTNITAQMANINTQANIKAQTQADGLQPIQNAAGNVAPSFSVTLGDLNGLTNVQQRALLQFYGQNAAPVASRENRLRQFLGIGPS